MAVMCNNGNPSRQALRQEIVPVCERAGQKACSVVLCSFLYPNSALGAVWAGPVLPERCSLQLHCSQSSLSSCTPTGNTGLCWASQHGLHLLD